MARIRKSKRIVGMFLASLLIFNITQANRLKIPSLKKLSENDLFMKNDVELE